MSASIDTVRTDETSETTSEQPTDAAEPEQRALEVSDVPPEQVTAYARATATDNLYFERKGGRTYLVAR